MASHRKHFQMLALLLAGALLRAAAAPGELTIQILDGDNAIMNIRQRVNREAIVEVDDENHKPVAGAAVTFFAPNDGPSAVFVNGAKNITVMTDAQGRASLSGMAPNKLQGKYEIRVRAAKNGQTANAVMQVTNMLPAGAAASSGLLSTKALLGILGAAAGAGIGIGLAVGLSGGNKAPGSIVLQPGTPSIAGPGH